MKKVLSVFLAALMLFSCFGVMAYAEESQTVTITFKYKIPNATATGVEDCVVTEEVPYESTKGAVITAGLMDHILNDLNKMPKEFSYTYDADDFPTRKETKTYKFMNFVSESDPTYKLDFRGSGTDVFTEDVTFVAEYEIEDTGEYTTFWEFIQSIFARINIIFEYFSQIFGF